VTARSSALGASGEKLLRDLAPQVLGAVIRRYGDFAAAEDAVQEVSLAAALQWPREGIPDNPRGWLIQVAARRMTDHVRSEISRRRRETLVAGDTPLDRQLAPSSDHADADGEDHHDTLILLFMCCHPTMAK